MRTATAVTVALITAAGCAPSASARSAALPALDGVPIASSAEPTRGAEPTDATRGASRVVRRYYAALDGLRRRMRTAPLADLMTADCPCRAQVRTVRAAIRRGERFTDRVRLLTLLPHLDGPDLVDVVVSLDVSRAGRVDSTGRRIGSPITARNLHREVVVKRYVGRWLIARVIAV